MRLPVMAALVATTFLAGCSAHLNNRELTIDGTTFKHDDMDEVIEITEVGDPPPAWSEIRFRIEGGDVRVELNAAPSTTGGRPVKEGETFNGGTLSSRALRVGDELRFCAPNGTPEAPDLHIGIGVVQEHAMSRFHLRTPACP